MLKIQYGELQGLYREAAYRGIPYVTHGELIIETNDLGTMLKRLKTNRHVKDTTPIAFPSCNYAFPTSM